MCEVYLAEDPRVSRQVAIKVVSSEVAHYPNTDVAKEATRLFQREARSIAYLFQKV
jgi:serine/threonine protein kinase